MDTRKFLLAMLAAGLFLACLDIVSASTSIPINDHLLWGTRSVPQPLTIENTTSTNVLFMNITSTYNNDVQPSTMSWVSGASTQAVSFLTIDTRVYFKSLEQVSQNNLNLTLLVCNSVGTCNPYQIDSVPTNLGACASFITAMIGNNQTYAVSVPAGGDGSWRAIINFTHDRSCSGQAANRYQQMFNVSAAYISTAGGAYISDIVPQSGLNTVNITVPAANGLNFSSITGLTVNGTGSVTNTGTVTNATACWYNGVTGALVGCNFTTYVPNNKTNFSIPNLGDGRWNVSLQMCGQGVSAGTCLYAPFNRTYNVDTTNPVVTGITPANNTYVYSLNQTVTQIRINATVTEANPALCWVNSSFNSTNMYVSCGVQIQLNTTNIFGPQTIYYCVNDTVSRLGCNSSNVVLPKVGYTSSTSFGNLETFSINTTALFGKSISALTLVYNGTSYAASVSSDGGGNTLGARSIFVPSFAASMNVSFYWITTNTDSSISNSNNYTQQVTLLALDNCTTFSNTLFNLTMYDEEFRTILPPEQNSSIETSLQIYTSDQSALVANLSGIFRKNSIGLCLNAPLASSANYTYDLIVRYMADNYAIEFYNIDDGNMNSSIGIQNISLYDLLSEDSTEFQLTFTGADFLRVAGALVFLERQYISINKSLTVELPKTDANGQTILHMVRNNVIYNLRIMKDGEVLGNFQDLTAFCEDFTIGNCKINLNAADSVEAIFDYYDDLGIIFGPPSFNVTSHVMTFSYLSADGTSKNVLLNVTSSDIFGNRTLCATSVSAPSATLTCNIDEDVSAAVLRTTVYVNGELVSSGNVQVGEGNFGEVGYLMYFILVLCTVLIFSDDKTILLISTGASLIAGVVIGVSSGSVIGAGAGALWALVLIVIGIWRVNKDRPQ